MTELGGGKLDGSGVCLVPEVKPGHRYRWLWRNREHYWNASHLRLILSAQSVSDSRKALLTACCAALSSVCVFFFHTYGYRRYSSLLCVGIFIFILFNAVYHCLQNHRCLVYIPLLKNSRLLCYFLSLFSPQSHPTFGKCNK